MVLYHTSCEDLVVVENFYACVIQCSQSTYLSSLGVRSVVQTKYCGKISISSLSNTEKGGGRRRKEGRKRTYNASIVSCTEL